MSSRRVKNRQIRKSAQLKWCCGECEGYIFGDVMSKRAVRLVAYCNVAEFGNEGMIPVCCIYGGGERLQLECRVRLLARRLWVAEKHVRVCTVDGRDWIRRRDYLIGWLDDAAFKLHIAVARESVGAFSN